MLSRRDALKILRGTPAHSGDIGEKLAFSFVQADENKATVPI
jgi:hypothetical protein